MDVPEEWKDAAEEVRAHLCAIRGGAPFLSPADVLVLLRWLEGGVPVAAVLLAIERAAEARRKARGKTPLSLVAAKRHLGRPIAGVFHRARPPRGGEEPLAPLVRTLRAVPSATDREARERLEAALLGIPGRDDEAQRKALAAVRAFLDEAWAALGDEGRARLRDEAAAGLGDLLHLVDEGTARALVEEAARDGLRRGYPALTAASIRELCGDDD